MTIWRWRHRICEALTDTKFCSLAGIVEADEMFQRESRKGSREWLRHAQHPQAFPMPPRHQWYLYPARGLKMSRGLSKWQKPILTLADRSGGRLATLLPQRTYKFIAPVLDASVMPHTALCSDKASAYRTYAANRKMAHYELGNAPGKRVIGGAFHIQTVNNLHSRWREWMKTFRGPATRYLSGYIAWFMAQLSEHRHNAVELAWDQIMR
jgi:hypothetical protein